MPRVNEEHTKKKRAEILQAAKRVCNQKPIYDVAMRDVVIESGMSQGGVYKYFSNIDDVFAGLLNEESLSHQVKQRIDSILLDHTDPIVKLEGVMMYLAEYIENLLTRSGSIFYQLMSLYSQNPERYEKVKDQIHEVSNLEYLHVKFSQFLGEQLEKKVFVPSIPKDELVTFIETYMSGVVNNMATLPSQAAIEIIHQKMKILLRILKQLLVGHTHKTAE